MFSLIQLPSPIPDPRAALLWFAVLAVAAGLVFWPRRGLVARWLRIRRITERVRVEDALKHLLNAELEGSTPSVITLAGALEISRAQAHELSARLVASGLARSDEHGTGLTDEGRSYALRMLRTHRLLERFFADRTGIQPGEWHDLAERREHAVSAAEVEALAARLGEPPLDPHGDPIPTAEGRLPPPLGSALNGLEPGAAASVVHVEDEPEPVFRALVEKGFHPGVPVKLVERGEQHLDVLVSGRPARLDLLEAAAVTVDPVPEAADHTAVFDRLASLRVGETAEVIQIAPAVQGAQRRRLLDLGVLPGTEIEAVIRSPSGDPVAYSIRGALIALRRPQAEEIYVRRRPDPEAAA